VREFLDAIRRVAAGGTALDRGRPPRARPSGPGGDR
jgi:hypothetical protein